MIACGALFALSHKASFDANKPNQRFAALNKIVTDLFERGLDMHASLLLPHSTHPLTSNSNTLVPISQEINVRVIILFLLTFCSSAYAINYSGSGMSCAEIGGFAQQVAFQKQMKDGVTLKEALEGMHESLSGGDFKSTEKALAEVINEIYKRPYLSKLNPDVVKSTFEHDCEIQKK